MPLHVSIVSVKNYKYIRVYSSYRNEKGQPRSRLIENHGRLDTALSKDPQYVEKLKERIAKENPYVPVCQLSKGIYLFKQKFHFLIRLLKAIRRITDQDSFKGTGLK